MFNSFYFGLSILCALFVYMLDYGLGKPSDETPSHNSLFSFWPLFLAKKRLEKIKGWHSINLQRHNAMRGIEEGIKSDLSNIPSLFEQHQIELQFKKVLFEKARPHFTFEWAIGICPICTGFWITLIIFLITNYFYYQVNIFTFILYFCFSHLLLRAIKKFI